MRIVAASVVSAPLLAKIHAAAFAAMPGDIWDEAFFQKLLALPTTRGLIAEEAGFILWQHTVDNGEIITIAVDPTQQGQGMGRALLATFESELKHDKVPTALLDVAEDNAPARTLYRVGGYTEIHRRKAYYKRYTNGQEHRVDALVMEKKV